MIPLRTGVAKLIIVFDHTGALHRFRCECRLETLSFDQEDAERTDRLCASRPHLRRPVWCEKSVHQNRSEEHTSELQSRQYLVCRLLLEKKKKKHHDHTEIPSDPPENTHRLQHSLEQPRIVLRPLWPDLLDQRPYRIQAHQHTAPLYRHT